jgi:hypothetical protein
MHGEWGDHLPHQPRVVVIGDDNPLAVSGADAEETGELGHAVVDVSANWHIGTPSDCPHGCQLVIAEMLAKLWTPYDIENGLVQ